jgi:hypothetical protein
MIIPGSDVSRHSALMDRAFRFQHPVFVEEKGWDRDSRETLDAIQAARGRGEPVFAGAAWPTAA